MKTKLQYIAENYNMDGIETEEQMKDLVVEHWNDMAENCRNEKGEDKPDKTAFRRKRQADSSTDTGRLCPHIHF